MSNERKKNVQKLWESIPRLCLPSTTTLYCVSSQYNFYFFSFSCIHTTFFYFILFHIMCYSSSVSFMPAFGLIVCAKFFLDEKKHVFFLNRFVCSPLVSYNKNSGKNEKTTQKSMWWKGYKRPYRLEFWVCLKKNYMCIHISKTEQKER